MHGIFHLGDSIDPRLDQCRRLCCDMARTANFTHAQRGIAAELVTHSRPAHSTYHRALGLARLRRRVALRYPGLLVIATTTTLHCSRSSTTGYLTCLPTPSLRLINPTRPHPHPRPKPTLALSTPTPIPLHQHQHPASIRVPHVTNVHLSRLAQHHTAPAWYTVKHPPSVQTRMGL